MKRFATLRLVLGCAGFALACVLAVKPAAAQVIFINADELPPEATNQLASTSVLPPCEMQVALVRFLPAKASKPVPEFPDGSELISIIPTLSKQGQVNLLYIGNRNVRGGQGTNAIASFDSVERRPAFSLHKELNQTLTNREFGLWLGLMVRPLAEKQVELNWNGRFMWSPDLLNAWAGEKYLVFGMRVAALLRPGLFYYESDNDEEDTPAGINIGALFKRKSKTPPKEKVPDISFLSAEDREIPIAGSHAVGEGQTVIFSTRVNDDPKAPEYIYLVLQASFPP